MSTLEGWQRTRQAVRQRVRQIIDRRCDEEKIQAASIDYLRAALRDHLVFAIPNAARRTAHGKAGNAVPGLMPGMPDLGICLLHGRILFLEVKTPAGTLSPDQLAMHLLLRALGHIVETVRSIDETRQVLEHHKVPTREAKR